MDNRKNESNTTQFILQQFRKNDDWKSTGLKYGGGLGGTLGAGGGVAAAFLEWSFPVDAAGSKILPNILKYSARGGFFGVGVGMSLGLGLGLFADKFVKPKMPKTVDESSQNTFERPTFKR